MAAHIDSSKVEVWYGGERLFPAPLITYAQQSLTNDGGQRVADEVTLTLNGTLLNLDDLSSGDASQMIQRRTELIAAVSGDNREFRIVHGVNGSAPSGTNIISNVFPRVIDLSFDEGVWTNTIPYSLTFAYETNFVSGQVPVRDFSDEWSFEEDSDKRVIRITHSVQAQGLDTSVSGSNSTALDNARTWVNARMGIGTIPANLPAFSSSGTLGDISYEKYRSETASITDGNYSAQEEIVMASGAYANSFTAQFQTNEEGITTVTINGNIEGLGRFEDAIDSAMSGWNNHVQPALSGQANLTYVDLGGSGSLNTGRQQSFSVSRDSFNGSVGYSISFNDNPAEDLPSGISDIQISKQITFPTEKTVPFEIPGRTRGSIVHRIGTTTDGQITVNGTIQGEVNTQLIYVKQIAEDEVNSLRPNVASFNELWLSTKNATENDKQKSFSFNLVWGYTDNLSSVQSASGEVSF